ncbi:MAG: type III secretion system chaperone [Victivallales bacterium]|nr:type III secretion system chaperone [Victivallales bacterium]
MDFDVLLERFGNDTGLGKLALDEAGTCSFLVDEMKVSLMHIPEGGHLLCFAEVGAISAEVGSAFLLAALKANYLFRGTGGATLSVSPDASMLFLNQSLLLESLSYNDFVQVLSDFVATLAEWKKLLADYSPASSGDASKGEMPQSSQFGFLNI